MLAVITPGVYTGVPGRRSPSKQSYLHIHPDGGITDDQLHYVRKGRTPWKRNTYHSRRAQLGKVVGSAETLRREQVPKGQKKILHIFFEDKRRRKYSDVRAGALFFYCVQKGLDPEPCPIPNTGSIQDRKTKSSLPLLFLRRELKA